MRSIEITNKLFDWFNNHDTFNLDRDSKSLLTLSENENEDRARILNSLQLLESADLISKQSFKDKKEDIIYWVLTKSLVNYSQTININSDTALAIASIINRASSLSNMQDNCEAHRISESEIQKLLVISDELMNQLELLRQKEGGNNEQ